MTNKLARWLDGGMLDSDLMTSFFDDIFLRQKKFWLLKEIEDIEDIEGGKRISLAIPGRTKDDINIEIEDDKFGGSTLKISAKSSEKKVSRLMQSFSSQEFCTMYDVSDFDKDSIDAKVENGILSIELKYKNVPKTSPRKIEIK